MLWGPGQAVVVERLVAVAAAWAVIAAAAAVAADDAEPVAAFEVIRLWESLGFLVAGPGLALLLLVGVGERGPAAHRQS